MNRANAGSGKQRRKFTHEIAGQVLILACTAILIATTVSLIVLIVGKGTATFRGTGVSIIDFLSGHVWNPELSPEMGGPAVGALPFIVGSIAVSLLALAIAAPTGIASAIFMTEISPALGERVLRPVIEMFLGIPSVVYGWIGLSTIVPFVRQHFGGHGFSVLSGGLVLSVMILPTIASLSADAIRGVAQELREAAYSLGSTRWQVIWKVILPASSGGIVTGTILALARAFGEALAVQMVIGNVRVMPGSLLDPAITLTSGITMDMGNTINGSLWNNALWSMAMVLLLLTLGFILLVKAISRKSAKGGA